MNLFSFLKERLSILDVVGEYITLKKAGGYFKGTCPFHHEKTASFTVSPEKQIFYCFGCHIYGDVISFMAKIENCSQRDAAAFLAERYKITLPQTISYEAQEKKNEQKNHYFSVCKAVALWCHAHLLKNPSAQAYFNKRGFHAESFTYFTIGYFPSGNAGMQDLVHAMKKEAILVTDLVEAGIIAQGRTTLYSPFEERLIFPIKDSLGRYVGFGGRIFKDHDTRPKYYNSRENDYFLKGSLLFGLDMAKKSIQEQGTIFLVEGYTDCIAMVHKGIPNTVATLGTACTLEHLKQLARYAQQLYVMYDNDTAGNAAILRLTEQCWQVNLELKVIVLPHGEDPASFLAAGGTVHSLLHAAQDIFLFFIDTIGESFISKPLNQKIQTIRNLISIISTITDPLKKDILLQKAAKTFDIPFESLKEEITRTTKTTHNSETDSFAPEESTATELIPVSMLEKRIFCAIMNNMQLLNEGNSQQLIMYLPSPLRDILEKLYIIQLEEPTINFGRFFDMFDDMQKEYISKLLFEQDEKVDSATFEKLLMQLQKKQWKLVVYDIKVQLTRAKQQGDTHKVSRILCDFMELQNKLLPHTLQTFSDNDMRHKAGREDDNDQK